MRRLSGTFARTITTLVNSGSFSTSATRVMSSPRCFCRRWAVSLNSLEPINEEDWRKAIQCIQPEEWTRIDRFHFREDELTSLVGRLLLRQATMQHTKVAWKDIEFKRTEKWKPYLAKPPLTNRNFSLNISHQGDYIIFGSCCTGSVGVDVMNIERPASYKTADEYINFLGKEFSKAEMKTMKEQESERDKMLYFYRYWCLKEAVIKALGIGIHSHLAGLDFRVRTHQMSLDTINTDTIIIEEGVKNSAWTFEESMIDGMHCAAVCRQKSIPLWCVLDDEPEWMKFQHKSVAELLEGADIINPLPNDAIEEWKIFAKKPNKPNRSTKLE